MLVFEVLDGAPGRDPGDIHDHVHRTVSGVDLIAQRFDRVVVSDVDRFRHADFPACRLNPPRRIGEPLSVDVRQEDLSALARGQKRGCLANAAGGAGEQALLVAEILDRHRGSGDGSDGTRTRGLRRDRPAL